MISGLYKKVLEIGHGLTQVRTTIATLLPFKEPNFYDPTLHLIGTPAGWGGNLAEEVFTLFYYLIYPSDLTNLSRNHILIYYIDIASFPHPFHSIQLDFGRSLSIMIKAIYNSITLLLTR